MKRCQSCLNKVQNSRKVYEPCLFGEQCENCGEIEDDFSTLPRRIKKYFEAKKANQKQDQ